LTIFINNKKPNFSKWENEKLGLFYATYNLLCEANLKRLYNIWCWWIQPAPFFTQKNETRDKLW